MRTEKGMIIILENLFNELASQKAGFFMSKI